MTFLGIDAGTSRCKVALFSETGAQLASAYVSYDPQGGAAGRAELDAAAIWPAICGAVRRVTTAVSGETVKALAVSSLGEAVVPVSADRRILGPSILNFDARGREFLPELAEKLPDGRLYALNGNTLGSHYTLPKLKWIQAHQPRLYESADKFLPWGAFISYMLGAQAAVDYSLANRTLLYDLHSSDWSDELLNAAGIDREKLPVCAAAGAVIGGVSAAIAADLGLPEGLPIVAGAHDQCASALGCGVIDDGRAVYGMGTYHCITPVFSARPAPKQMISRGLNTEQHAVPGRFVTFIYNQGGALVKWYRDTFAAAEHRAAVAGGESIYPALFAEMPDGPGRVTVLPHFMATGPPHFIADSAGVIAGLKLGTTRGEILRAIIEAVAFSLKVSIDALPQTGIAIDDYRAAGGGSRSDSWVQTNADIFARPMTRVANSEAGVLGAALIAGFGSGHFSSLAEGVQAMVHLDRVFEPDLKRHEKYQMRYNQLRRTWPAYAAIERREKF